MAMVLVGVHCKLALHRAERKPLVIIDGKKNTAQTTTYNGSSGKVATLGKV